jgi:S1-C subfamily serine protease
MTSSVLTLLVLGQLATPAPQDAPAEKGPGSPPAEQAPAIAPSIRDSVVKVITTFRAPDLQRPWTKHPPDEVTGTGVIIDGNRILTNAHVAQFATRTQIQPAGSTRKYIAEVKALASGIDLAILTLRDSGEAQKFFADHQPLKMSDRLPKSGDRVDVYGFPIGGEQLSVTTGIVNRIDYSCTTISRRG